MKNKKKIPVVKENRYFMFSAVYDVGSAHYTRSFGTQRPLFPSYKDLKSVVVSLCEGEESISNIVILSVCELSKSDFHKFWDEQ